MSAQPKDAFVADAHSISSQVLRKVLTLACLTALSVTDGAPMTSSYRLIVRRIVGLPARSAATLLKS